MILKNLVFFLSHWAPRIEPGLFRMLAANEIVFELNIHIIVWQFLCRISVVWRWKIEAQQSGAEVRCERTSNAAVYAHEWDGMRSGMSSLVTMAYMENRDWSSPEPMDELQRMLVDRHISG